MKASFKYDESFNTSFSTFSELYIKGEILDFIRKDKNLRVSRDFIRLKRKIDNLNKGLSIDEISILLNEPKEKIIDVLNTNQNVRSIYEKIDDEITLEDTISKENKIDSFDLLSLKLALEELSLEDKNLISERYYNGKTQEELAKEMNMSQSKVYRLEKKILNKLEDKLKC